MTLATLINRNVYTATAAQTTFVYAFRILAQTDLRVYVNDTLKTLTTDYTVTGVGDAGGGTVVFVAGLTLGDSVIIYRATAMTQETDYIDNDRFSALSHETALDKLTMIAQDIDYNKVNGLSSWYTRAYRSGTNQTIVAATPTRVQYNSVTSDAGLRYDAATNYRYTVPTGGGGGYLIHAVVRLWIPGKAMTLAINKTGTGVSSYITYNAGSLGTEDVSLQLTDILSLVATDYIDIWVYSEEGNQIVLGSANSYVSIVRIW